MYLIKVTQRKIRGTWRFHFYVYDDAIHGRKLASAGYINGNDYESALIESFSGVALPGGRLLRQDYGSDFTIEVQEARIVGAS